MGKRRVIFILLAVLVTAALAWNNYASRSADTQQETQPVVSSEPANDALVTEEAVPVM
jgi:lipopolysaccharide export system protein LptC